VNHLNRPAQPGNTRGAGTRPQRCDKPPRQASRGCQSRPIRLIGLFDMLHPQAHPPAAAKDRLPNLGGRGRGPLPRSERPPAHPPFTSMRTSCGSRAAVRHSFATPADHQVWPARLLDASTSRPRSPAGNCRSPGCRFEDWTSTLSPVARLRRPTRGATISPPVCKTSMS